MTTEANPADRLIASIWGDDPYIVIDINEYDDWLERHGLEHAGWDIPKAWPHGAEWPMLRVRVREQ